MNSTMMKPALILAATLLLVACELSSPPFKIDYERYAGAVDRGAGSPGTLIRKAAIDFYEIEYFRARNNKAMAQSKNGSWGEARHQFTPEAAMDEALAMCRRGNANREALQPCQVVNVNGFWAARF